MHMSNWLVFYHNVSFEDMSCDFVFRVSYVLMSCSLGIWYGKILDIESNKDILQPMKQSVNQSTNQSHQTNRNRHKFDPSQTKFESIS